ncbi:MAG: hypothetical protein RLZZ153_1736, partial [Pseudomonadota bacterium]
MTTDTAVYVLDADITSGVTVLRFLMRTQDPQGVRSGSAVFAWEHSSDAQSWVPIASGPTLSMYQPGTTPGVSDDVFFRARVSYTDGLGNYTTLYATSSPQHRDVLLSFGFVNAPKEDVSLTPVPDPYAVSPDFRVFSHEWQRGRMDVATGAVQWNLAPISTAASYTPGDDDIGQMLRVKMRYTNGENLSQTYYIEIEGQVENTNDTPDASGLLLTGQWQQGQTLSLMGLVRDADLVSGQVSASGLTVQWQAVNPSTGVVENLEATGLT